MSNLPVAIGGASSFSTSIEVEKCDNGGPAATDVLASAAACALEEKSDNTRRAYGADFTHFSAWCAACGAAALPASIETTAGYLASLADAGLRASTITRRCARR